MAAPNSEANILLHGRDDNACRWYVYWTVIFCAFAGALGAASLSAATIAGTVFDPSHRAVPLARVTLLGGLIPLTEQATNAQGRFRFSGLDQGVYRVVADAPGLSAAPFLVHLERKNEIVRVNLSLALSAVTQQVVVSASLGGSLASQVGSSVSVISRGQLDDEGAQNLDEVLRQVPGVTVNDTGRRGGVTSIFVRGGNSDYNLVIVDGMEVNQFGGDFDFSSLPADGLRRVEIVRDPESALYGSNAVTSVINVIGRRGEGPPHFDGRIEMGSNLTRRFATGGSGLTRGIGWAYDLSRLDSDGVVRNDEYRDQSAFFSLDANRNPRRQADFHFFGNANDAGAPGPYGSDPDHLSTGIDTISRDKQNLIGIAGSYAEQFSRRFRQVVAGSLALNDYYFRSPYGDSYSNNLRGVVNTRSELTLSNQDFLIAGFEYNREQIQNTFITDANNKPFLLPRASYAAFAENRWNPSPRLFLIAGARLDDIRTHDLPAVQGTRPLLPATAIAQFSPRISAAYLAHQGGSASGLGLTRFHASFGTGIRAPDGFELAFTNNPRLKPERSLSFDSGIEQRLLHERVDLDATYFYNRFKDQIVVLGGSLTNLSSFISDNLGNSRAQGMEFSVRMRPRTSLSVAAQYTLLSTSILALNGADAALSPFHVGQSLIRRPRNSGSFDVTWFHGRLTLNANAAARGSILDVEPNFGLGACSLTGANGKPLPCLFSNKGYWLANAGFQYQLPAGIQIYGRINNLLNQKYEESLGYPALRLNFLAGIRFNLPPE